MARTGPARLGKELETVDRELAIVLLRVLVWFGADGDVRRGGVWPGMELETVDRAF